MKKYIHNYHNSSNTKSSVPLPVLAFSDRSSFTNLKFCFPVDLSLVCPATGLTSISFNAAVSEW